jgi:subtilisin family serine protease
VRKTHLFALGLAVIVAVVAVTTAGGSQGSSQETEYVVVYAEGASLDAARQAVAAAGGTIVSENTDVGVATVRTTNASFLGAVSSQSALYGATSNRPIGYQAPLSVAKPDDALEAAAAAATTSSSAATAASAASKKNSPPLAASPDPLAGIQWDMAMIHATATGSYAKDQGDPGVTVGVIDTGVDASHPDIAPNFSSSLSRNFVTDIPAIDGACEFAGCVDPVGWDDGAHGTHVAGTIGAALNGLGIAGVAPKVTIVNIRAGQDSGFFFLQPSVDALTYAGDAGIDVVNMSYFIDPWLFNCPNNPADTPTQQLEQRTILEATTRALRYAHRHHVTLVAAEGNEHSNLDASSIVDTTSPDYPAGTSYSRTVDTSTCFVMPTMGPHVISVSALGPSGGKADYSNYSFKYTQVSAPGGYFRDFFGTPQYRQNENQVLSTYPQHIAQARGQLNPDGTPNTPVVVRSCQGTVCGYYQYLQGTSMASPHAAGVAALIVSHFGHRQGGKGGKDQLEMNPERVQKILERSATDHACPSPPTVDYTIVGRPAEFNATCVGDADVNNFYGEGVVDALSAVSFKDKD